MVDQEKISQALSVFKNTEAALKNSESNVQKALVQLRDIAGKTFSHGDQFYQVRERKGNLYMCELDGPPKGRPKKDAQALEGGVPDEV